MVERCRVLDLYVHRIELAEVTHRLDQFVRDGRTRQVATVNMDFIRLARRDGEFRDAVNSADLSVPDGVPVLWAARLSGEPLLERVTGVDIVEQGAALAAARGYSIFLLGGEPGVADAAAAELVRRNPGLRIAGTYAPPFGAFSPEENDRMLALIRAARPEMLFVAFGAPRQDIWIRQHRHALDVPVCVGVGGTFNFLTGGVPRAPRWMQRTGLEWAYRLACELGRLWRRYIVHDLPVFLRFVGAWSLPLPALRRRLIGTAPLLVALGDVEGAAGD